MILAFEVGRQFVFIGAVNGLSYALLALGVILIYRSSRIINFAVGATGVLASQVMAHLVIRYGAPYWVALVLAVLAGAAFLGVAELTVVRRLFTAPRSDPAGGHHRAGPAGPGFGLRTAGGVG